MSDCLVPAPDARILPGDLRCPRWLLRAAFDDTLADSVDVLEEAGRKPDRIDTILASIVVPLYWRDVDKIAPALEVAPKAFATNLAHLRVLAMEHLLNDYGGRGRKRLLGGLQARYRDGAVVDLVLYRSACSSARSSSHASSRAAHRVLSSAAPDFARDVAAFASWIPAGTVPMHPQEVDARDLTAQEVDAQEVDARDLTAQEVDAQEVDARDLDSSAHPARITGRATVSGRTIRVKSAISNATILLKCDFSHVVMDHKTRPMPIDEAAAGIATSDSFHRFARERKEDNFAFLPEVYAVGDTDLDVACVVRAATPFPPGKKGAWYFPLYCLWADAAPFGQSCSLLVQLIENHQRDDETKEDACIRLVLSPIIATAGVVFIDLASAHSAHGQNWLFEVDAASVPTGRIIISDLGDIWEHPLVARDDADAGTRDVDKTILSDAYRQRHAAAAEADIGGAFVDQLLFELLHRALCAFEVAYGVAPLLRERTNALIAEVVESRRHRVQKYASSAFCFFAKTYLSSSESAPGNADD